MGKKKEPSGTKVISFRLADDIYKKLEELAASEKDEAGLPLNASTFARRLMLQALREREKKRQG